MRLLALRHARPKTRSRAIVAVNVTESVMILPRTMHEKFPMTWCGITLTACHCLRARLFVTTCRASFSLLANNRIRTRRTIYCSICRLMTRRVNSGRAGVICFPGKKEKPYYAIWNTVGRGRTHGSTKNKSREQLISGTAPERQTERSSPVASNTLSVAQSDSATAVADSAGANLGCTRRIAKWRWTF